MLPPPLLDEDVDETVDDLRCLRDDVDVDVTCDDVGMLTFDDVVTIVLVVSCDRPPSLATE